MKEITKRFLLKLHLILLTLIFLLAGCSTAGDPTPNTAFNDPLSNKVEEVHEQGEVHRHISPEEATAQIQVVLVPSELTQGPNRFAIGIFDVGGDMVHEGDVHLHYYDLNDPANPFFEMEADATALHTPDGLVTVFTHERSFNAGEYGVEVELTQPDGSQAINGIRFNVLEESLSIEVGEKAPLFETPTLASRDYDLSLLTSAQEPNPAFYEQTLAEAIQSGRPTMLLFATPSFCQTRFCGPTYEIFNEIYDQYWDRLNFIHVEVFSGLPNPEENNWEPAPAIQAFGLESEPWIYLIGADGTVLYRVEGMVTQEEIERHLQTHLGSS